MPENAAKQTGGKVTFDRDVATQAMLLITMLMGSVQGKPGVVGTGLLAASKQSMVSHWEFVRRVEIDAGFNVI